MADLSMSESTSLGSNIGGGIGDLIGYFLSMGDREKARELIDQATAMYAGLDPNVRVDTEGVVRQGGTEFDKAQLDPAVRGRQLAALDQLQGIWSAGGLDPIARAQMAEARAETESTATALNNSIMQDAAQRGMADSGTALAARRSNAQAAANRGSLAHTRAAAAGQQRSMDALDAYLGGAGQVRGQDEAWAAGRASSQDAINRFNAANEQAVSGRNIDRSMEGQQATFSQGFQKASGVGSAAGAYQGMADDTQKRAHNIGKGIGGGIGAAVPVLSDERFKADVVREAEEALPGVPFATWEWPDQPGVRHRGVIAQDLERVAPEHVFTRGDGVKFVDYSFLGGEA
jgi:hypothetical protein